ncbi:PfkB family carbohydrate kinase [uncultured Sphaerochaeta sp.]|uniref:1-phosphofructokinase family hexose kinase n=1 Tax=uncultured Sphaerochaeta sp. TaxID=886478 RepID=UPI002AA73772|nr:PfkB family carbohydrate kinase [uncultured Sphaerochaeta sp.]
MKILSVCLNPTFQITMRFPSFSLGEVNRAQEHYLDASGKGMNAARIVSQLGHESLLLTHLGGNRTEEMLGLCRKDGVSPLWADSGSAIRTCVTVLTNEGTTELVQEPFPVDPACEKPIRNLFSQSIKDCDGLIILGTRAPGYSDNLYADFVMEAKMLGKFVLLDLKGEDLKRCLPHHPDVVKINLSEAVQTFLGIKLAEHQDTEDLKETVGEMLGRLYEQYGSTFVLSRGSSELWVQDSLFFSSPTLETEVVNTIGCGDSLSAALTVQLLKGEKLQQAVFNATKVATMSAKSIHPASIV